jgi:glycosyltransferase involved in cell wall biosynthesis
VETLSIVIPAYNEEQRLPATLERIISWSQTGLAGAPIALGEIVVVDDGSRDSTAALVESGRFGPLTRLVTESGKSRQGIRGAQWNVERPRRLDSVDRRGSIGAD